MIPTIPWTKGKKKTVHDLKDIFLDNIKYIYIYKPTITTTTTATTTTTTTTTVKMKFFSNYLLTAN